MKKTRGIGQRILLLVGSLGPLGHAPASGTVTVLVVGIPLFWVVSDAAIGLQITLALAWNAIAVWIHQVGDRLLGEKDSRKLVWDEIAGFLVAIIGVPFTWQLALAAFVVERTFDIAKFFPANWIERRWPGGLGVVGDDFVAGLYTLAILHIAMKVIPQYLGI